MQDPRQALTQPLCNAVLAGARPRRSTAGSRDEAGGLAMPSCVPGSSPAAPRPLHRDRGRSQAPGPPLSARHRAMESLIVVTECEATGMASEEEMSTAAGEDGREPRAKLNLSGRKLSLQERSHTAHSPGSSDGASERFIYPSLPYSPVTSPHSSPRLPRRPTVESNRVSITGLQVRPPPPASLPCIFGMKSAGRWWEGVGVLVRPWPWGQPRAGGQHGSPG